jgi:multidrug transporter EmrE-like cation transporter
LITHFLFKEKVSRAELFGMVMVLVSVIILLL